jgi:hypothetical protein
MPVVEVTARRLRAKGLHIGQGGARVVPGFKPAAFRKFCGVTGDFFGRAVHRAGKDGDFHQSDPEAEKRAGY